MLTDGKKVEENIVLWANAEILSKLLHVVEDIKAIHCSLTLCWFDQSCQHTDSRCFSCTVMSQQRKNLSFIHGHTFVKDGCKPIFECFL